MSEENVNIKITPKLDDSGLKSLERILQEIKKPIPVKTRTGTDPRLPQRPEPARRDSGGSRGRGRESSGVSSISTGKKAGETAASGFQSDLDEGMSGGFYNAFSKRADILKSFSRKKAGDSKSTGFKKENNDVYDHAKYATGQDKKGSFENAVFKNVKIDKMDVPKSGATGGASGFVPPTGGATGGATAGAGGTGGKILGSMAKAVPFAGVAIAGMVAGALKLVSDVGRRHVQAIQSQKGTFGATGGYVSGGSGYFASSEVAQAGVASGKISGQDVYKKGNLVSKDEMKFAASQGAGLSEVVGSMAKLKMGNAGKGINYYRGAASETGFSGLRQNEYLSQLANLSDSFRKKGFSGDMTGFTESAAGIGRSDGATMDPSRRMAITERTTGQAKKGIFGGGIGGSMAMSLALQNNKGDFHAAMMDLEKNASSYGMQGEMMLPKELRGIEAVKRGDSYAEATGLTYKKKSGIKDASAIDKVGFNQITASKNEQNSIFAGKAGASAAQIGFEMQNQLLKMFEKNQGAIDSLAKTIHTLETGALNGLNTAVAEISPSLNAIVKGDFSGAGKEVMELLKKGLKEGLKIL